MSNLRAENSGVTATTTATAGSYDAFQLPLNMSASTGAPTTTTTMTTTLTRHNVSVTNIKCEADELVTTTTTAMASAPNGGNIVPVMASMSGHAHAHTHTHALGHGSNGHGHAHGGGFYNGVIAGGAGVRIPVPKTEAAEESDSEAELTNIENLKVTRRATSSGGGASTAAATPPGAATANGSGGGGGEGSAVGVVTAVAAEALLNRNGPRPMSWEGELSETEAAEGDGEGEELMDTENSLSAAGGQHTPLAVGVAVIKSEATTPHHHQNHQHHHQQQQQQQQQQYPPLAAHQTYHSTPTSHRLLHTHAQAPPPQPPPIKTELGEPITVELHGAGASALGYTPALAKLKLVPTQSDPINLKYEPPGGGEAGVNSPLLARNKSAGTLPLPANPSPDSAIHSVYTHSSPSQSPLTSRHAPYTPSLSRNNSDASHSSCYSYSSEFSPTHSPIQGRHAHTPAGAVAAAAAASLYSSLHHSVLYRPISLDSGVAGGGGGGSGSSAATPSSSASSMEAAAAAAQNLCVDAMQTSPSGATSAAFDSLASSAAGISRQQLINSPCPICGDKISGFHYGIFSCESCKGFFKRTVQNRKNYVCVRGGPCPVSIATRKKCPACRFEKCLQKGMKLEAIREDRTRGGRSTYQCSYTLPNSMLSPLLSPDQQQHQQHAHSHQHQQQQQQPPPPHGLGQQGAHIGGGGGLQHGGLNGYSAHSSPHSSKAEAGAPAANSVPTLLQEIMDVEHLWQYNEAELARLNKPLPAHNGSSSSSSNGAGGTAAPPPSPQQMTNPLLASAGLGSNGDNTNPDLIAHLCNVADHRLYKIVKWCKSLPLFKHISIDDQICLLINSWCELLLFSCCFRSVDTPGEIKMSQGKTFTLPQAKSNGLQACIERMLNLTDHLRRLRVDRYEYVAMKVIVLLQSDTSELQEPVKVRECQEKALQSLQSYTLAHYPETPSKFGELLLRIPELQRTCQLGKEMLTIKSRDGDDFNLLMELLRGEH